MAKDKKFTSADLDRLESDSAFVLSQYLQGDVSDENFMRGARVAATVFSACQRRRQSDKASDALNFMMAREIAVNKDELQDLINRSMPGSPFAKKIEG